MAGNLQNFNKYKELLRIYNDGKYGKLNIKKDILPYDQTKVELKSPIDKVDYINASWIQRSHEEIYGDIYEFLASSKINLCLLKSVDFRYKLI